MSRTRVVHIGKFYPPFLGGIETHLQLLCRELAPYVSVDAIVSNDCNRTEQFVDGDVKVTRVARWRQVASAPICPGLLRMIHQSRPDVLHVHMPNPSACLAVLASGYKGPIVTMYHSDIVKQRLLNRAFQPFAEALLERSSAIIVSSQRYLETSPVLRRFRDRCQVIPYGIDTAPLQHHDGRRAAEFRSSFGKPLLIAVGRLVYYKGFDVLLEAMARPEVRELNAHLLLVGGGPLESSLLAHLEELGLSENVTLAGSIDNEALSAAYHAADAFVFPSVARSEAFGLVQLEAMACGLPVINTNLDSGVPFVSRHNESGLTVPPRNSIALAGAIRLILTDNAMRTRFGREAKLRVEREFTAQVMAEKTLGLYERVLQRALRPSRLAPLAVGA